MTPIIHVNYCTKSLGGLGLISLAVNTSYILGNDVDVVSGVGSPTSRCRYLKKCIQMSMCPSLSSLLSLFLFTSFFPTSHRTHFAMSPYPSKDAEPSEIRIYLRALLTTNNLSEMDAESTANK